MKPKIVLAAIALGLAVLLLTACGTNAVDGTAQPASSTPTAAPVTPTATPTVTPTTPTPSMSPTVTPAASSPDLKSGPDGIVYTNKTLGFQLTFPKDWDGYFNVREVDLGQVDVIFVGKSEAYSTLLEHIGGYVGREMFSIVDEDTLNEDIFDSPLKLGTVNGIDYYYAMGTSAAFPFPYGPTEDYFAYDDGHWRNSSGDELFDADTLKAYAMCEEIPAILKTFTPISNR